MSVFHSKGARLAENRMTCFGLYLIGIQVMLRERNEICDNSGLDHGAKEG